MFAALSIDGNSAELCDEMPDTVCLEFNTDDSATHGCRACGEELTETPDGYEIASGEATCADFEPVGEIDPVPGEGPHDPERIPLSWCKSAAVRTDESEDFVTVSISVGGPRGAFSLTIRRVPDDVDSSLAGHLIMHAPYAGQPLPHTELTPLHDGTFVVGPYASARQLRAT